jgi:predicted RND superfamily exporter protein
MDHNGITGKPLDYGELARDLRALRMEYAKRGVTLHILGYAMIAGDMILGIKKILAFFAVSFLISASMLYHFTRSLRCTLLVEACTFTAVIWQLGLLPLLGYDLDPYSVLVPFLIFAIGMSHGAQKMNGVTQDIGRGTHKLVAARYTFRRLFMAGFTALMCDALGFAVLGIIGIQEIHELAVIASLGVGILIFTNLILLPVLLSYVGVDKKAASHSLRAESVSRTGDWLAGFTRRERAIPVLWIAALLAVLGFAVGRHAQIGIVDNGAPELRYHSTYNADNRYIVSHYNVSSDVLTVFADSQPHNCTNFSELAALDRLEWQLNQLPEVQSTLSMSDIITQFTQMMNDDAPKWGALVDNQPFIDGLGVFLPNGFDSVDCQFIPLNVALYNLKSQGLNQVVSTAEDFINNPSNQGPGFKLSLAGGNGGIAYATDRVITQANTNMLIWIYGAVSLLCLIAFRSLRAVLCAILPLILTSLLCQGLMVVLGIGVTVATLPVVALGVGIGVDYALYVLGVMMVELRAGVPLEQAYRHSLLFTGRVVILTGFTLAAGVGTWIFAPIKFQADMGTLLAFMFLWNMFGALIILPALASFLLKPSVVPAQHSAGT